jgi:hypothetical protein
MKQFSLRERIRHAYKLHPQAGSQEILALVGTKDTMHFRVALLDIQNELRTFTAPERKNHHAHPLRIAR